MRTRYAWETFTTNEHGGVVWVADHDTAIEKFARTVEVNGVIRWQESDNIPPADCMKQWHGLGLVTFDELTNTAIARDAHLEKVFADYSQNQSSTPSAEELFELRANFEPGTVVVDVISGRRTKI